jgi:cation diffusion facilitator CzcD-associated flavoprotein CzcO
LETLASATSVFGTVSEGISVVSVSATAGAGTSNHHDLLVIGAGPYGYACAAYARERGIRTHVVGRPMSFWRENMPAGMFLRSGPDWHLDARGKDTFEAYFEDRGLRVEDHDPIPIGVFCDYTDWFRQRKGFDVDERLVAELTKPTDTFAARMEDGSTLTAERVIAAPGIGHFTSMPPWYDQVPAELRSHTCDLVSFDDLAGVRVAVIGGRQSAYEWAALLCDHGAEQVAVVHRHAAPAFAKVSWAFVDPYVDQTLAQRGWWRNLSSETRAAITAEFWRVGRLTLEHWLAPRLSPDVVTTHAGCAVTAAASDGDKVALALTDASTLVVDRVVFATGYRTNLEAVPYLGPVLDRVRVSDGWPELDDGFQTSLPGLSVTGFASTRDFGPFYGFTKGCPSAARIAVDALG